MYLVRCLVKNVVNRHKLTVLLQLASKCASILSVYICCTIKQDVKVERKVLQSKTLLAQPEQANSIYFASLQSRLNWYILAKQKVAVCYNILHDLSIIPSSVIVPHSHPSPGHPHSPMLLFLSPKVHQICFPFSFIVLICGIALPDSIVLSPSVTSFKCKHKPYLFN